MGGLAVLPVEPVETKAETTAETTGSRRRGGRRRRRCGGRRRGGRRRTVERDDSLLRHVPFGLRRIVAVVEDRRRFDRALAGRVESTRRVAILAVHEDEHVGMRGCR